MPFGEVYFRLQTGAIGRTRQPRSYMKQLSFMKAQQIVMTIIGDAPYSINNQTWDQLSKTEQASMQN